MPQFAEPEYEQMFGVDSYLNATAKIYRGVKFRKGIVLYMGENTVIYDNCVILVPKLVMEKGSQINAGTIIAGKDEVILEENVVVSYLCLLLTASDTTSGHFMNDASPEAERKIRQGIIQLKKNVFIGSHSTIMPNVTIEEGIVVKAYSYVNDDLDMRNYIYGMKSLFSSNKDYLTLKPERER